MDRWQSFVCISNFHIYLIRSLYWNYINDFLNSYNAFILTQPKAIPTQPRGQNMIRYFDPPPHPRYFHPAPIIDDKVLFAFHNIIYLIRSITIYQNYIDDFLNSHNVLFWHCQKLSQLDLEIKISYDILTPSRYFHPPTNQWQSFVCISYLLDKIIMLKLYQWFFLIVIMLLFWNYQKISQLDPGVKIFWLTPLK